MLNDYLPILIMVAAVLGFGLVNLILTDVLGARRRAVGKADPYECGMAPTGTARMRLSIHFYLVAVLFILFDVESLMLLPWAVAAKSMSTVSNGSVAVVSTSISDSGRIN